MRIVLDAMGSDTCPVPDVEGAVQAAHEFGDTIILVGDETRIQAELVKYPTTGLPIEVVHAGQTVTMEDTPSKIVKGKPDSSLHVGLQLVEDGKADAFVTCGNTGAVLAVATTAKVRRIQGIHRPALSSIVPFGERHVVLIDIGANADCKPEYLVQFALMGSVYAEKALGTQNPTVALLSNGEEEGKGNELTKSTLPLLTASGLNFIGNIEPKEMLQGHADVIVSDGFVGNMVVKTLEATSSMAFAQIRNAAKQDIRGIIGGLLMKPVVGKIRKKFDPFEIGGAPLLGVNGVVIVGHGRSNAYAVKNAIRQARLAVAGDIVNTIRQGLVRQAQTNDHATNN
ncbi:MAG: phosphate acyltransferase PlsX [Chloroflexi bacterium]|nr:phosphate acyltransferase PlsX [Chloroflexota bacterium]